jgi:hypothetical protein
MDNDLRRTVRTLSGNATADLINESRETEENMNSYLAL